MSESEANATPAIIDPVKVAAEIVAEVLKAKNESPFIRFLNSCDDGDAVVSVMIEIATKYLVSESPAPTAQLLATQNHALAAKVMMVCGAMLEGGAPCAEELAPPFLQRIKVAMQACLESKGKDKDAWTALKKMYLPIVAAFSVSREVRRRGAPQDVRDLLAKVLAVTKEKTSGDNDNDEAGAEAESSDDDEDDDESTGSSVVPQDLAWLQRMINIKEDEHVVVIEPSTGLGAVVSFSGVSDLAQVQVMLNIKFPLAETTDKEHHPHQQPGDEAATTAEKLPKRRGRKPLSYTWNMWNGFCGDNLDEDTLQLTTVPDIFRAMLSQEASIDEIPFVTRLDDGQQRLRVIVLAPPLYQRNIDPKGVFHNMAPDMTIVKRLSDDEVKGWLRACIAHAKATPMSEEVKIKNGPPKPYPLTRTAPAVVDDDGDDDDDSWVSDDEECDGDDDNDEHDHHHHSHHHHHHSHHHGHGHCHGHHHDEDE